MRDAASSTRIRFSLSVSMIVDIRTFRRELSLYGFGRRSRTFVLPFPQLKSRVASVGLDVTLLDSSLIVLVWISTPFCATTPADSSKHAIVELKRIFIITIYT